MDANKGIEFVCIRVDSRLEKNEMTSRTLPSTPSLGVCYYPEHLPADYWAADFDSMREIGIRLVRLGEFAWSRLEPDPGETNSGSGRVEGFIHRPGDANFRAAEVAG